MCNTEQLRCPLLTATLLRPLTTDSHPSQIGSSQSNAAPETWLERHVPGADIPEALLRTGTFCGGVIRDYRERLPYTLSDFTDGVSWKTLSAALFMFCATFASTVALGDVAFRETDGMVGITEYLMLQGVSGVLHSLFSACPLPILRPTGPITAFMIDLYQLSSYIGVGYYALLSWVGFWVGLFLILIALFDLSVYISLCTRFLHDIYAVFVCTIYITDGLLGVSQRFHKVRLLLGLTCGDLLSQKASGESYNQPNFNLTLTSLRAGRVGTGLFRRVPRHVLYLFLAAVFLHGPLDDSEKGVAADHLGLRGSTCGGDLCQHQLHRQVVG